MSHPANHVTQPDMKKVTAFLHRIERAARRPPAGRARTAEYEGPSIWSGQESAPQPKTPMRERGWAHAAYKPMGDSRAAH